MKPEIVPGSPNSGMTSAPVLTYGQKAVGITFNPGGSETVNEIKKLYAQIIDLVCAAPVNKDSGEEKMSLVTEAIRQAQTAQMWAVKAVTYQY